MDKNISNFQALLEEASKITFTEIKSRPHLMPTIFNSNDKENFISDWLAFILNPKVNSVGVVPLNILLKLANRGIELSEDADIDMGESGEYSDCREVFIDNENTQRIDFLFGVSDGDKNYLVAIENKVYAGMSGDDQLEKYEKSLDEIKNGNNPDLKDYAGYELIKIFMSIDGGLPTKKGNFAPVSHRDFVNELKNVRLDFVGHLRESFLIQEYITNMEEYIMDTKEKSMSSDEFDLIAKYYDIVNTLNSKYEEFNREVKKTIFRIVNKIINSDKDYETYCGPTKEVKYLQWYKKKWGNSNEPFFVHYEILFSDPKKLIDNNKISGISIELHVEGKSKDSKTKLSKLIQEKKNNIDPIHNKKDRVCLVKEEIKYNKETIDYESIAEFAEIISGKMNEMIDDYDKAIDSAINSI